MKVTSTFNKTAMFAESLSDWSDGSTYIEQLAGTYQTIHYIVCGTVEKIVQDIGFVIMCKVLLAMLHKTTHFA